MSSLENIIKWVSTTPGSLATFFVSLNTGAGGLFNRIDSISSSLNLGYTANTDKWFNYLSTGMLSGSIHIYVPFGRQDFKFYERDTPVYVDTKLDTRFTTPPFSKPTSYAIPCPILLYKFDQGVFNIVGPA